MTGCDVLANGLKLRRVGCVQATTDPHPAGRDLEVQSRALVLGQAPRREDGRDVGLERRFVVGESSVPIDAVDRRLRVSDEMWSERAEIVSTSMIIGRRSKSSYCALRALNHSRSLFRFSARRNAKAFGLNAVKRAAGTAGLTADITATLSPGGVCGHALLHLSRQVRHAAHHPLEHHELPAVVHLVLFG
jgi:hypothetical protein